jgi:hypothetical protein
MNSAIANISFMHHAYALELRSADTHMQSLVFYSAVLRVIEQQKSQLRHLVDDLYWNMCKFKY